jgi:iron complex transport system ATP-binding protein
VVVQGPIESVMTAENLTATFGMSLVLAHEDGRYAARRRSRRHVG